MSLNTSMTAGRHFTVLLHVGGVRKILRDVALSDTHDVLELVALHAQLRTEHLLLGRGSVVEYFDERHQTFLEVTELSWPRMSSKRHIELRCDQRGGASSSSAQRLTAAQLSQQRDEDDNRRRIGVSVSNLSTGSITQAASGETAPLVQPSAHGLITAEHPSASAPRHHHQPGNNSASASTAAPFSAGSTAGGGAPASPPHAVTMTLKAHIVDAVRKCLAREYPSVLKLSTATSTNGSHATSMPTLVRICAAVLREYQSVKGLRDVTMNEHVGLNTTTTDVKRFIDDIAREVSPMVKQEVLAALREGLLPQTLADLQQPQHPHLPHHPQHAAAMPLQAASANVLPIEKPQVLQASASNSIKDDTSRQISRSAVHTYSTSERHLGAATYSTANVVPPPLLTKIAASSPSASASGKPTIVTPHGNVAAAATPILPPRQLQDDANGYYHQPTVSPSARGSVSHAGTASPATSTFQKVQYSVCGPFPPPPFGTLQDQRSPTIRVSLSSPSTAILPDEDILITAHVIARTVSSLTWWLGYGPQRITLNMDELYRRGAVTTFQVSETGLLLTIRRGTLVPGWQYHVHLSASSEITGVTAADHTSFMLSKSATQAMAAAENGMGHHQQQSSRGGGATSVRQHHLRGYDGDEEKSSHVHSGGGVAASPVALWNPHSPTAASPPAFPSTPSQAHDVGSVRKQQHAPVDPHNPAGMTYQEQLKRFFVDEVQPLYRLCSRPNIRQVDFNDMLQEIARAYWYSRGPEESLDVAQQREIVERVKNAVVAHRSLHRAVNDYRWGGGVVGAGGESSRGSVMHNASTSPLRGGGGGARGGGSSSQGHASFGHTQVAAHASHSFGHKSATDILPAGLRPQYQSLIR